MYINIAHCQVHVNRQIGYWVSVKGHGVYKYFLSSFTTSQLDSYIRAWLNSINL